MYTLISRVIEEVPAWEECVECEGQGMTPIAAETFGDKCTSCNGLGGKWHEAVRECKAMTASGEDIWYTLGAYTGRHLKKSSRLIRTWEVCEGCGGAGKCCNRGSIPITCPHCYRDAEGKPTGAEQGTAGPWRVKE